MVMIAQETEKNKRYLPHEVATKVGAVKLYCIPTHTQKRN